MDSGLTSKMISEKTGAPFYVIKYLSALGRLPVLRKSPGRGYPTIFHPDAIAIVRKHLEKSSRMLVEKHNPR